MANIITIAPEDIVYDINLDLQQKGQLETIDPRQYDTNTRFIRATIWNNGIQYPITSNVTIAFVCTKPDGLGIYNEAGIDNQGRIIYKITEQTTAKEGSFKADFRLYDTDVINGENVARLKTPFEFKIHVVKSNLDDNTVISQPEFNILTNNIAIIGDLLVDVNMALSQVIDVAEAENGRITAEGLRVIAEQERVIADELRGTTVEAIEANYAPRLTTVETQLSQIAKQLQIAHYDYNKGEYVNLDQFWNSLRNGKIYTTEFNQFHVSPSSVGTKKDDNVGLVCEPSTNAFRGRNDYEKIGLFMSIDVNAFVDENDDYHVTAIKGDGRFKKDGTNGDVYVMAMVGYVKRYSNDNVWGISYSDAMHSGFEVIDEAVKPDGTIRPFLLHAKYGAGRNPHENNNLASISGTSPEWQGMSHNDQITKFKEKGLQYSGKTSHDDFYVQLMFWLKYANLNNETAMMGCIGYHLQYTNLVAETGVKRVIITNAQASNLVVGSTVSIGDYGTGNISADRQMVQNYNLANRVNILDVVDLGNGNSVVYVDSPNVFDTKLTTTILTYPWNTGACDNVLGTDGSPFNNMSGKEPFIINGIEMMLGGYEILQNLIVYNNNTDSNNYKIQLYACYDCYNYATTPNTHYDLVGHELAKTNNTWAYISKLGIDNKHPSIMVPIEAIATSTTGFADGLYTNTPTTGYRAWRSLGFLSHGSIYGLRYLNAGNGLANSYWHILGRLSATGRSRRRAGVN